MPNDRHPANAEEGLLSAYDEERENSSPALFNCDATSGTPITRVGEGRMRNALAPNPNPKQEDSRSSLWSRTVQPGRRGGSMLVSGAAPSTELLSVQYREKTLFTMKRTVEFFGQLNANIFLIDVTLAVTITALVLCAFPSSWRPKLNAAKGSGVVGILGGFMSFALVFRTMTCYNRWWEARQQWGRMSMCCLQLAGQARTWFVEEERVNKFLMQCVLCPHVCKAVLRGDSLAEATEEGAAVWRRGSDSLETESPLTDATLEMIARHGGPFACTSIMRRLAYKAFVKSDACEFPMEMRTGPLMTMEQTFFELNLTFAAFLRIKGTGMPATYTVFMRSVVVFFFMLATLLWAPSLEWLTPLIIGFMALLINTVIIIGDQMMRPFDLRWSGLPLEKLCNFTQNEIMNVSRQYSQLNVIDSHEDEAGSGNT